MTVCGFVAGELSGKLLAKNEQHLHCQRSTRENCGATAPPYLRKASEIRAVQLDGHPFFFATLFQPERAAFKGTLPPLVTAFVRECSAYAAVPAGEGSRRVG